MAICNQTLWSFVAIPIIALACTSKGNINIKSDVNQTDAQQDTNPISETDQPEETDTGTGTVTTDELTSDTPVTVNNAPEEVSNGTVAISTQKPPILLDYANQTYATTVQIANFSFTNQGFAVVSCSVLPPLPTGLNLTVAGGTCLISGTPSSVQPATVHTITGTAADQSKDSATVRITVLLPNPPIIENLANQLLLKKEDINTIAFVNTGASVSSCAVAPALPDGLQINASNNTCEISGTANAEQIATSYTVSATAADGSLDTASVQIEIIACPTNYIIVPANADQGINHAFCVMKYEAKLFDSETQILDGDATIDGTDVDYTVAGNWNARSVPTGMPWTRIQRKNVANVLDAERACSNIGAGYSLISNAQHHTITLNLELAQSPAGTYLNWSNNSITDPNYMNRGHSDGSDINVSDAQPASTDDDPCAGTGNASCATNSHSDFLQKRTHTLSNGEIIWDLSGNVFEWVKDDSLFVYGNDAFWTDTARPYYECTDIMTPCLLGHPKHNFGPSGDYSAQHSDLFINAGLGKAFLGQAGGAFLKGGAWYSNDKAGIFTLVTGNPPTAANLRIGFRCVYDPR